MSQSHGVITRIPRDSYAPLRVYAPPAAPVDVELADNTNQWGAPPSALRALHTATARTLTHYPRQPVHGLAQRMASYVGTNDISTIATGCGSDDVLDCIMRALAEPGDGVAYSDPTFVMASYFARTNGLSPVPVPFGENWQVNVDALLAARARIVYVCSPNNPTGTVVDDDALRRLLDESEGIVVLDEAYAEFTDTSWAARAPNESRLVVLRTLSKAFGLAGLRIGFGVGSAALVGEIEKACGPFKVNAMAERVALAVFDEDLAWVAARAADAREARSRLREALSSLGLVALPSEANFLLVPIANAQDIAAHMRNAGVAVRAFANLAGIGDALRITVGPAPLMTRCVEALGNALRTPSADEREPT